MHNSLSTINNSPIDTFIFNNLPPRELQPEFVFNLPELRYPTRLNCVTELLDRHLDGDTADRMALRGPGVSWTYRQLSQEVNRIAHVLTDDLGLVPGNRVLLRGANSLRMAACWLAVIKAGGIAVPTMPLLRAHELTQIVDKAQVTIGLCADALSEELRLTQLRCPSLREVLVFDGVVGPGSLEARMISKPETFHAVDTAASDVCLIAFTSGTTGLPKGTMHVQQDMLAICDCFPSHVLRSRSEDIFIGTPPLAFTFGLGGLLLFPLRVGATAILHDRYTPLSLLQAITQYRATVCFTAPTFYRQMAQHATEYDLSSLRQCVSAGEALPVATRDLWRASSGLELVDGIGTTEMLHIFIASSSDQVRPGATGKPVPGYKACVVDDVGRQLPTGVIGRLAVKGPTGCRYLSDPRQAEQVINGWNLTGDAYEVDSDGYFWPHGRIDDMIVSAGYNIAAIEIENALLEHIAVAECAVVGVPDIERGQVVKAFVVVRAGLIADDTLGHELQEFVKRMIAPYKYPRRIEFRTVLPRTDSGKLQRFRLRIEAEPTC
jgi:2-aminobenzoate-CoA ligase